MYTPILKSRKVNVFSYIYLVTLLLSFHSYFITYINSSFLQQFIGQNKVGILYAVGAIINIFILLKISRILEKFGNYVTMLWVSSLEIMTLVILATTQSIVLVIIAFILHQTMNSILLLSLDEFLESASDDKKTGYIRGIFNTLISVTSVVSPVIVGSILAQSNYSSVYIFSALFLLPLIFIVGKKFKKLKDNEYHKIHISGGIQTIAKDKNLRNIYLSNLLLQIFYSWMVIYIPIYLHESLGFSWQQLGLMISIALLPFVLFEIPVGTLADRKLGEKEILITGFVIISIGLFAMTLNGTSDFILWTAILFFSRIGASFVEITSESYFFKHININNQNLLSVFRTTWPMGYVLGPLAGSIALIFIDERYMFLALGLIMLLGIKFASSIRDTR
jgi:MFS family permease